MLNINLKSPTFWSDVGTVAIAGLSAAGASGLIAPAVVAAVNPLVGPGLLVVAGLIGIGGHAGWSPSAAVSWVQNVTAPKAVAYTQAEVQALVEKAVANALAASQAPAQQLMQPAAGTQGQPAAPAGAPQS